MRRPAVLLLLVLPATAQEEEQRVAREVAEAHAKGDRGRLVLLAAEPPLRVNYARVVDALLRGGHVDAADALARERQGPEAEGLARLVGAFRGGAAARDVDRKALREAALLAEEDPEGALRAVGDLRSPEGTLFSVDVSWARARVLSLLDRDDEARAEFERCAALARAAGELRMVRDAEEARFRLSDAPQALAAAGAWLDAARLLDDRAAMLRALFARARLRAAEGRRLKQARKLDEARLRWRDARDDYLAASDIAEQEGDRRQQGLCWLGLAVIWQVDEGAPGEALKFCDRAIQLLRGADAADELDGAILNSALVLTQLARYDDALARLEELLSPDRSAKVRAKALEQKAYVLARTGRLRSALSAYAEALAAAAAADRVRLLVATGELNLARRDAHAALRAFDEALALAPDEPAAWTGRAHALGLRGDEAEARAALRGALEREKDPAAKARWQLNTAQLRSFGDVDEAAKLAWEALRTYIDLTDLAGAGAAWATVAELTMLQGDQAKAAEHLAKAATIFYRLSDASRAIGLYAEETLLLLMLRRPEDAVERLQILLKTAETTPNAALKGVAKSAAAIFEARGGRGGRALELLDEAGKLARSADDRVGEATVLANRALVDPDAAVGHARSALALLDEDRLWSPEERPLVEGYLPDWTPGIALDGILKSNAEAPEDAFLFLERALANRLLLALGGRDRVLLAGLSREQHDAYVAARADLVEARATGNGIPEAEAAFDAMVARLRKEAPAIAGIAWPRSPPLADIRKALRADEVLVLALFDPYAKCALFVDRDRAILRPVAAPGNTLAGLPQGCRTVLLASPGPVDAFAAPAGVRVCHVATAAAFLRQRTTERRRGEGVATLCQAPERLGPPVEALPDRRLAMVAVNGNNLAPLRVLARRFDAETVVVTEPVGVTVAAALLAAGAGNVVAGGRPPGPLDAFLDACLDRKLPVAAAFLEASAKGPLFFYGAPE